MTQDEARRAILAEWHSWAAANTRKRTGGDALRFFQYLQKERNHLLSFRAKGDKWQVVHRWLLRAGLVSD